jgi:hypothetical protein
MTETVSASHEIPVVPVPPVPSWCDDYVFQAFDFEQGVGMQAHLSSLAADPQLVNEFVTVMLPGGVAVVRKSCGRTYVERGLAGACLGFVCEDPGRRWHLKYHGPATPSDDRELDAGQWPTRTDGLLDIDVVFESAYAPWLHQVATDDPSFAAHYEQPGRLHGVIRWDDAEYAIAGYAFRDHNRGPRSFADLRGYSWVHGELDDGRAFSSFVLDYGGDDGGPGRRHGRAAVWGADHSPAEWSCPDPPLLASRHDRTLSYPVTFGKDDSRLELSARVTRAVPFSITRDYDYYPGTAEALGDFVTFMEATVFTSGNLTGYGLVERLAVLPGGPRR